MAQVVTQPAVLIRLRPTGPWRYGPGDGAHDRVDTIYRSDRVFSAVAVAMQQFGFLDEWLEATARASVSAVAFSSLYPYQGDTLFATPPTSVWPPPAAQLSAPNPAFLGKIHWNAVQLVPLSVIEALLNGRSVPADQWTADAATGCLLRRDRPGSAPFRVAARTTAAVDRVTRSAVQVSSSACVEFEPDSGLWTVARYRDGVAAATWQERVQACFRLLADSGFGGRRTQGWGKTEAPEFRRGNWPNVILPRLNRNGENGSEPSLYWLLSLYSPATADAIDWTGGDYRMTVRGGRVAASGSLKKNARMIAEGSVLSATREPAGAAVDVAPDNFAHPVYRSGLALALKLPLAKAAASDLEPVETPSDEEAFDPRPCDEAPESTPIEDVPSESGTGIEEDEPAQSTSLEDDASESGSVESDEPARSGESIETAEGSTGEGSTSERAGDEI